MCPLSLLNCENRLMKKSCNTKDTCSRHYVCIKGYIHFNTSSLH